MTKLSRKRLPLLPGETPINNAPEVVLDDGTNCIPQHYLTYQHSLASVSDIVSKIHFDDQFVLFVDQDNASIFIQVGIVGKDNYLPLDAEGAKKIVYGRRWRVEPQLPSSEIIQTAFLAISKAREHEIRELFKCKTQCETTEKYHTSTPFSCHQDLPLISMSCLSETRHVDKTLNKTEIESLLASINYDGASFRLVNLQQVSDDKCLLILELFNVDKCSLPELRSSSFESSSVSALTWHLLVDNTGSDAILYSIMDQAIYISNRHVEEHFRFQGHPRFSRKQSVSQISALSAKTRAKQLDNNHQFDKNLAQNNYETDMTRVPQIGQGKLGEKIKSQLTKFDIQYGILPKDRNQSQIID